MRLILGFGWFALAMAVATTLNQYNPDTIMQHIFVEIRWIKALIIALGLWMCVSMSLPQNMSIASGGKKPDEPARQRELAAELTHATTPETRRVIKTAWQGLIDHTVSGDKQEHTVQVRPKSKTHPKLMLTVKIEATKSGSQTHAYHFTLWDDGNTDQDTVHREIAKAYVSGDASLPNEIRFESLQKLADGLGKELSDRKFK